ncbi:MAG: succinylglutamate desuccinylase/aspartoacylase family protein [Deltaproteobacteria bacterium]|jgi:hypothetical protein|nr:succinylglutamate desuccinylase/aspartoacylase family protein [Deltaproteobacteria bacterium]
MPKKLIILTRAAVFCLYLSLLCPAEATPAPAAKGEAGRQHLVFFRGTPQELAVYKVRGRQDGPTVMLLGGIHGDEPGAYASADLYADLVPRRGNLIIVPRANFRAVLQGRRGPGGDMNRKFSEVKSGDPEGQVVAVLKSLMAESDLLLTLHDGSGFYRPEWESEQAGPNRYGQCIIADSARYTHPGGGPGSVKTLELEKQALAAIAKVNAEITEPLHKFHFFNMETAGDESLYREHRDSATYFALTRLGLPAFCIETSKNLPGLDEKIRQHNLVINAFLDLYGVELEAPGLYAAAPEFSHLVIRLSGPNGELPLALANGQTLLVKPGDSLEVLHAGASVQRGLLVAVDDGFASVMRRTLRADKPFSLTVRRDSRSLGQVNIDLLADPAAPSPQVSGQPATLYAAFTPAGVSASLDTLPGHRLVAELELADAKARADAEAEAARDAKSGEIVAFLLEVDGKPVAIKPGEELPVLHGSLLKLVDIRTAGGPLPKNVVMNLKGFVSRQNELRNTGEDRGATADVSRDMLRGHSAGARGEVYAINAEQGKTILAGCSIRLIRPALESVTIRLDGQTRVLRAGSRTPIAAGAKVELLEVALQGGHKLGKPRYTLAGHPVPERLPQTLTMREIAINLAVFNNDTLAGKVTWIPRQAE